MNTQTKQKGLTGFQLKYLALILMVMDHIHYFFAFTGKIPEWFSMLGRLAAPLFLFCVVEGFAHTHGRRKYFLRIYGIAIGMGLMQLAFNFVPPIVRGDGFYPQNSVFQNFVILIALLQGIEWCRAKKWGRGLTAIVLPLALPYLVLLIYQAFPAIGQPFAIITTVLHFSILPLHTAIMDGGTFFILEGVLLYLLRNHRKVQAGAFFAADLLYYGVINYFLIPGATPYLMLTQYYEWMGAFAAILMLLYNGQRGHGSKMLFYWFYPAHVYVLYLLSFILYGVLN